MAGSGNTGVPGAPPAARPATWLPPHEMVKFSHFLHRAAHDPSTRHIVAALAQRLDPNDLGKAFADVSVQNQLNAFRKEMKDAELTKQVEEARKTQAREKAELVDSGRFTKEQVDDIEKTMIAKGLHSYKDGAILWQADQPPAPPPAIEATSATWDFPSVVDRQGKPVSFKDFSKDTKTAAYNAAFRVIDEFKMGALPSRFRAA